MLSEYNEYIMKAYEELDRLSLDPKARMLYEAREKELLDTLSSIQEGWNRGLQQGIEQSTIQKAAGVSIDVIAATTGLTIEKIQSL